MPELGELPSEYRDNLMHTPIQRALFALEATFDTSFPLEEWAAEDPEALTVAVEGKLKEQDIVPPLSSALAQAAVSRVVSRAGRIGIGQTEKNGT